MTKSEENTLIKKVLSGDKNAFSDIVLNNQQNVYALAFKITRNEQDALDISQEAFIKAYRSLPSFRGGCRLSVWLYRITYNLCMDFVKSSARKSAVSLTSDDEGGSLLDIPDDGSDPQKKLEKKELKRQLLLALDSLSSDHREILLMREFSGLSYDEIAQALNISPGTVKSRISRARRAAADFLIKNGTFYGTDRQKGRKEGII